MAGAASSAPLLPKVHPDCWANSHFARGHSWTPAGGLGEVLASDWVGGRRIRPDPGGGVAWGSALWRSGWGRRFGPRPPWVHPEWWALWLVPPLAVLDPPSDQPRLLLAVLGRLVWLSLWSGGVGVFLGTAGAASNAPRYPKVHPECWSRSHFWVFGPPHPHDRDRLPGASPDGLGGPSRRNPRFKRFRAPPRNDENWALWPILPALALGGVLGSYSGLGFRAWPSAHSWVDSVGRLGGPTRVHFAIRRFRAPSRVGENLGPVAHFALTHLGRGAGHFSPRGFWAA